MHIAFTSDNNYLRYLGVTMCSVCENNPQEQKRFHVVLSGEVQDEGRQYLEGIAAKYGAQLSYFPIFIDAAVKK